MSGQQQQNIFTIQEQQQQQQQQQQGGSNQNNNEANQSDILIDTSSIPLTQHQSPPMQHLHHHHHHGHQHQMIQPTQVNSSQATTEFNNSNSNNNNNNNNNSNNISSGQNELINATITSQPGGGSSKVAPENQGVVYSVHPCFSVLDQHETLLVRQRAQCSSTCCGFESANTYTVRAKDGSPIMRAIENSNCCERCCFETNREYNLSLVYGDETVARIRKPFRISRFCCYTNAMQIESPEDNPIGFIKQQFTLIGHSKYSIYDCQQPPKKASFVLESSSCRFCCTPFLCTCLCNNREFRIINCEDNQQVGTITRQWTGGKQGEKTKKKKKRLAQLGENSEEEEQEQEQEQDEEQQQQQLEQETQSANFPADHDDQVFGIQFETNLEARQKVLLLSACFMMDFFYFENDRRRRKLASC